LAEACTEKNKDINIIDNLITDQNMKIGKQKWYQECGKDNIENSRRKCPQCNIKLPTLAETQETIDQTLFEKKDTIKPLIFKSYQSEIDTSKKFTNLINPINITQRSNQKDINVPNILVPDLIPINPNSIKNVQKVLEHIKEISEINKGERKWIAIVYDRIPYYYAQKFKNDYPEILLISSPLHEEMNMLKSFVKLNWQVIVSSKLF